jgi:hypothetical protein
MRVLKFELNSGIIETLITNIFDEDFTVADFKELYFKRWSIEVKYNEIKNKLQIENFTGETPIAIEQDFYATMYLANMVALAKKDANQVIEEEIERNVIPIRPDRTFERKENKSTQMVNRMNKKRAL